MADLLCAIHVIGGGSGGMVDNLIPCRCFWRSCSVGRSLGRALDSYTHASCVILCQRCVGQCLIVHYSAIRCALLNSILSFHCRLSSHQQPFIIITASFNWSLVTAYVTACDLHIVANSPSKIRIMSKIANSTYKDWEITRFPNNPCEHSLIPESSQ